jgi:molybdopterin/thiamine biosynthesis adenylyltransferase/rhodanese-related sulfurtransferase
MARTYLDLLDEARAAVPPVSVEEVRARLEAGAAMVLVDVREADEWREGRLPGAVSLPRGVLEMRAGEVLRDRGAPLVVYCASGARAALAARTLRDLGYERVERAEPGFSHWRELGLPVEAPPRLTAAQRERYARHLLLPEVGEAGQAKLLAAKVLVLGAGGLGSPAALYLAAAGVGTLGLVDHDAVDVSNLQRQILHSTARLGRPKVESAARALADLNPEVRVVPFAERLEATNVDRIVAGFDLVVDGCDNFPTRYLVNDAGVRLRKPIVHGSVHRFEGRVTVFDPSRGGPCYRCLFPAPPPRHLAPSCQEAGVLGVLPGIIGTLQAAEALKHLLGIGEPLAGRLLAYDARTARAHVLRFGRDPACPACGDAPAPRSPEGEAPPRAPAAGATNLAGARRGAL